MRKVLLVVSLMSGLFAESIAHKQNHVKPAVKQLKGKALISHIGREMPGFQKEVLKWAKKNNIKEEDITVSTLQSYQASEQRKTKTQPPAN